MKCWKKLGTAVLTLLLCMTSLPLTRADAAGSYQVKETRVDNTTYFSVYSNEAEMEEDHFYTTSYDVFESTGAHRYRLTFYQPFQANSQEQAKALQRYLGANLSTAGQVGRYSFSRNGETFFWLYKIEGWDDSKSVYNLEEAGPWYNAGGEQCNVMVIGRGDQVSANWSYIHYTLGCSVADWFPQTSPQDGMTVGFSFGSGGTVWRYCLD